MKKFFTIFISFFIFLSLILPTKVFAETPAETDENSTRSFILASVGIKNIKIVSQKNNRFVISFDISNGKQVQAGVKYSIKLIKETEKKGQSLVDQKIYDESLTLSENSRVSKEITYIAPPNLDGEYTLFLSIQNESGFRFNSAFVGKINLIAVNKGIEILSETCFLFIAGEKNNSRYNLTQGVDIDFSEKLYISCTAKNTSDKNITTVPVFETYHRNIFGEMVDQTGGDTSSILFSPNEKKEIYIELPKATTPQAYDIKVNLKSGNNISNSIIAHYVLQGVSATIQKLSLDKDYYEIGDTANLLFSWTPSADSYFGSRLGEGSKMPDVYVTGSITNKKGNNCALPINELLSKDHTMTVNLSVPIIETCLDPKFVLSLVDVNGNILNQKTIQVETAKEKNQYSSILTIAILLVFIIILSYLYFKKKNDLKGNSEEIIASLFIAILMIVGAIFYQKSVNADISEGGGAATLMINGGDGGGGIFSDPDLAPIGSTPDGLSMTLNLSNGTSYACNSNLIVTTEVFLNSCANEVEGVELTGYISNGDNSYTGPTAQMITNSLIEGGTTLMGVTYFQTPPTVGNYILNLKLRGYGINQYYYKDYDRNYTSNYVSVVNFPYIRNHIIDYVCDIDASCDRFTASLIEAKPSQINSILNNYGFNIELLFTTSDLRYERNYDVAFSVTSCETVDLQIRKANVGTWSKSLNANVGDNIELQWYPTNAGSCTLKYDGNTIPVNAFNNQWNKTSIGTIQRNTTYTIDCQP